VIIIVPHTSWVDFFLGLLIRSVVDRDIKYLAKQSLFKPPVGWLLRATGGTPIDRTKSGNTVKIIKEIFDAKDEFRLALSPEGTRKAVSQWKSGFYFIARAAKAPIVLVAFDYGRKEIKFSPPQHPSGNLEEDIRKYKNFFEGVGGKVRRKSPLGKRQKNRKTTG
jgi:1-acyl-sn-glycerol-3-phosphate acyltransferase